MKKFYSFLIIVFVFASCRNLPMGYISTNQNAPLLTEAKEVQLMGTFGSDHVEAQIAFSPIEHVGLLGNLHATSYGTTPEIGVGYYHKTKNDYILEYYAIFSNSQNIKKRTYPTMFFYKNQIEIDMKSNYNSYGLQTNIGKVNEDFTWSLSLGFKNVNFSDFYYKEKISEFPKSPSTPQLISDSTYLLKSKSQNFIIIAPSIKFGKGWIKYFGQISLHFMLSGNGSSLKTPPFYRTFIFTNGILLDLKYKK